MKKLSLLAQFSILSLLLFIVIGAVLGSVLTSYFQTQELNRQKNALAALLEPAVAQFLNEDVLAHGATDDKKYGDIDYAFTFLGGVGLVFALVHAKLAGSPRGGRSAGRTCPLVGW